jgi:hypothetical protein
MAILHVFADESSDKRQQGLLTVGGFMGLPESFSEAEKQWTALLKSKGISYFRAYEAELLDGQFGSLRLQLEPRAARAFEEGIRFDLGRIIWEQHLGGIAVSLHLPGFYKVLDEHSDAASCFGTTDAAIWACGRFITECIERVNSDLPQSEGVALSFTFDCHPKWEAAERAYKRVGSLPRYASRFGAVTHADDKRMPALQMADLCAYEARHLTMQRMGWGGGERIEFTCMDRRDAFYAFVVIREEELLEDLQNWRSAGGE